MKSPEEGAPALVGGDGGRVDSRRAGADSVAPNEQNHSGHGEDVRVQKRRKYRRFGRVNRKSSDTSANNSGVTKKNDSSAQPLESGSGDEQSAQQQTKRRRRSRSAQAKKSEQSPVQADANGAEQSLNTVQKSHSSDDESPKKKRRRRKRRRRSKYFIRDKNGSGDERNIGTDNLLAKTSPLSAHSGDSVQPIVSAQARDRENASNAQPQQRFAAHPVNRLRANDRATYAALDLGTNNCRLLMAVPTRPGQFRVVDAFSRIVRLGEGLSASGNLSNEAMARAISALKVCSEKLKSRNVKASRLIATEACRAALNGEEFLHQVHKETGLELEVVDRETEARLAVSSCGPLVDRETDGLVLFDIGGGSSEIALIDLQKRHSRRIDKHIVSWTSLPVGVVSLAEKFGGRDVTPAQFETMVQWVSGMIDNFEGRDKLAHLRGNANFHLLGTSGTVTTLAGIFLNLQRYDRRRVDGIWMNTQDVSKMTERLLSWDFAARVANPCIGADRADLVLAGCAILEAIRRAWPSERLRVADRGLREGILSELMTRDDVWHLRDRRRKRNVQ